LRGYYRHLATLRDHYQEVDSLLSGEIPSTIASSFRNPESRKRDGHGAGLNVGMDADPALEGEGWRRNSAWKVDGGTGRSASGAGHDDGDGDVGEGTGLLDGQKREERRERLARIAINGEPPPFL
jgi:hypothetical protein